MDATLIILGIGFLVWLVSTIYKNAEEARKRAEPQQTPRRQSAASEIDRFLEEIQRRRSQQQASARPAPPPPLERPRPVQPILIDRPRPSQKPPVQARPVPAHPVKARPVQAAAPSRPAIPARLVGGRSVPLAAVFIEQPEPAPLEATLVADAAETPESRSRPAVAATSSAVAAEVRRTLRSRNGIKQAFLASVILGPPRARQPRSGGRWL
jgi:hypothetical protein